MKIIQKFIPLSIEITRPGIKMDPLYITIHETDNTNKGADAEAHANLQYRGNTRQASWQYTVDDSSIYQSIPDNEVAWAAGDGNGLGNRASIHIEICVNSDGNYQKAVENAAWLTDHLMDEHNIPLSKVVQHNHWSGKNCPRNLRSGEKGIDWNDFLSMVSRLKVLESTPTQVEPEVISPDGNKKNISVVDYLNGIGQDSSFNNRAKLAKQYFISNYSGTAEQNLELLDTLRKGTPDKPFSSSKKGDMKTNSIVDYLNSINVNSSLSNRKKLAEQYGIKNYNGKASQNLELLDKLRGEFSADKPKTVSKSKTKKVYLPAADSSWRVYPTNKAPVRGNEKGFLNPKKFGGLSYEILGNPQKDVYTIQTDDFGKVNIYAAPSTGAVKK